MAVDGPTLRDHKLAELQAKVGSIRHELAAWRSASEEGMELEKFHTRIRAIANTLDLCVDGLDQQLVQEAGGGEHALDVARRFELAILEVHRVWEFFRSKLAFRYIPWLEPYLLAADELAWSCFEPAQHHLDTVGREPPLLFLNSASSPFTMRRGSQYQPEEVEGEAMTSDDLSVLLQSLPIPVIGVPWFQLEHLPDALVIAHEVGHDVQEDLRLDDALDDRIRAAVTDEERLECWLCWRDEVFADVFGALMGGPAFASALTDFVADAPQSITTEQPAADAGYPTSTLRVLLVSQLLEQRQFDDEAEALRCRWQHTYGSHEATDFEADLPALVGEILAGPYEVLCDGPLTALDPFTPEMQDLAIASATDALSRQLPRADDGRTLIAAARLAYERGDSRYAANVPERILRKLCEAQEVGVRGTGEEAPDESLRDDRDREVGLRLAAALAGAHGVSLDLGGA